MTWTFLSCFLALQALLLCRGDSEKAGWTPNLVSPPEVQRLSEARGCPCPVPAWTSFGGRFLTRFRGSKLHLRNSSACGGTGPSKWLQQAPVLPPARSGCGSSRRPCAFLGMQEMSLLFELCGLFVCLFVFLLLSMGIVSSFITAG